jgi:uncharacterized coiled-coil DUF342 family protein
MSKNKFEKIKEAVEKRDDFLKENPHMQPLQDEINKILAKSGNQHNRIAVLEDMIYSKIKHLAEVINKLKK